MKLQPVTAAVLCGTQPGGPLPCALAGFGDEATVTHFLVAVHCGQQA